MKLFFFYLIGLVIAFVLTPVLGFFGWMVGLVCVLILRARFGT